MSDKLYNKLIGNLAGNRPEPESAGNLTNRIIENLPERKNRMAFMKSNKSAEILVIFRLVTSTAAMFLIIFFIWQQREIESKLTLLEKQVAASGNSMKAVSPLNINASYQYSDSILGGTDSLPTDLVITRRSLNYLLGKIKSLEDENKSLRQRFIEINQTVIKN